MKKDEIVNGVHIMTEKGKYEYPESDLVLEKLEEFKDKKLGFMTHFGLFTELALIPSWPLTDDLPTAQEDIDWVDDLAEFKKQYWQLIKAFNPGKFDPKRWAHSIKNFGFKYVLIPTKHHEGFCLWDTEYTDFKVTSPNCPFSTNKHADIFGSLTKELQKIDISVGAYFSKADWNHEDFWPESNKKSNHTTRFAGYNVQENPDKWENFVQFTQNQMLEIIKKYEPIDIMWLDAGQVNPNNGQDIRMDEIAKKMRELNPGLIITDRTIGGKYENYFTPECHIPQDYMEIPWESCMKIGERFAYSFNDKYITAKQVCDMFVEILCKGGNLALNIAPQPDGKLPTEALIVLSEFGDWVKENEHAIYGTRPVKPYFQNGDGLVKDKAGNYYLYVKPKHFITNVPKYIHTNFNVHFSRLSYKGQELKTSTFGEKIRIYMPLSEVDRKEPLYYVFKIDM